MFRRCASEMPWKDVVLACACVGLIGGPAAAAEPVPAVQVPAPASTEPVLPHMPGLLPLAAVSGALSASAPSMPPPSPHAELTLADLSPVSNSAPSGQDVVLIHTGHVVYRVPKAAVVRYDPSFPWLSFTYPGFRPMGPGWSECLVMPHKSCSIIELILGNGYPLGTDIPPKEWKKRAFENFIHGLQQQKPKKLGKYYIYGAYDRDGSTNYYYSTYNGRITFSNCMITYVKGRDASTCSDDFFLSDGNSVHIRFERVMLNPENPNHLEDEVDAFMRQLHVSAQGK